jgi:uncharacterized protein involved in exopolysaccharide biosynthesis
MNIDLSFYWKLFWRRFPVMAVFVLVCSGLGVITAMKTPETWATTARLLVEAPQITQVESIEVDAVEQLEIIEQKLLTRANLVDIANRFDVFENIRSMEPDTVVERMRSATRIRRSAGRNKATLMTISFEGRSGKVAADVVNEYTTLVLEENAESRNAIAENTLQFFEREAENLARDLDRQSTEIAVFKSENANALPEDQTTRFGRQTLLQDRLARLERELQAGLQRRADTERLYKDNRNLTPGAVQRPLSAEEQRLISARAELDLLKSVYSETNPRVKRKQAEVTSLEAIVAAQQGLVVEDDGEDPVISQQQAILDATLSEIDSRLDFIRSDIEATKAEMENLQRAISRSSANGIELNTLEREYEIIQTRYNAAVSNLNEARMTERIESTAQGQRISVIENANIPQVPAGPNRPKIAALGLLAGLGLAAGYFMLLETLNRTVRRPAELMSKFNVTPITTIPYMETHTRRVARRAGLITATIIVLIGVPLALWYIDTNYLPLDLLVQRGLDRLGLG